MKSMTRIFILFLILLLTKCDAPLSRKESKLAKELSTFLMPGKYDVQVTDYNNDSTLSNSKKEQLTLTKNLWQIEFEGVGSFNDLDSIKINLKDSTLFRQFSINHFIDTFSVSADKKGFNEDYFGYAFGENDSGGIADIPEFRHFFNKENMSKKESLFIIGRTKENKSIVIRQIERIISSGRTLLDVNKTFILTHN